VVSSGPIQPYPPDIPIPPIVEPLPPEPPKASEAVVKDLKKRWRPLRAEAPAKCKAGKAAEVAKKVDDFLKEAREKYAHEIVAMVEEWLHEHKDMFTTKAKEPEKPKAPRTTPKPKPTTPVPQTSTPKPAKTERSQGEAYIQDWKLKEALEWCRSNGPASIAKALSEVQRAKRGVDQRAAELSRLRTNPRPEQIQRIVEQLQQFLGLCRTAGLDPQKYQDLLREFRKIK
ncbi:MAG: hypothetical protein LUC85_07110, partial [Bacteroidales bacterium]|nr:hypothetical protein [Bacteroidales bacterium]